VKNDIGMDIQATKLELMQLLLQTQKESLLKRLKDIFDEEQIDWWQNLSEEEKAEIEMGLSQADNGSLKSNESVMKHFDKWH